VHSIREGFAFGFDRLQPPARTVMGIHGSAVAEVVRAFDSFGEQLAETLDEIGCATLNSVAIGL